MAKMENIKIENIKVACPICDTEFITGVDSDKTQCPHCDFEFEIEQALKLVKRWIMARCINCLHYDKENDSCEVDDFHRTENPEEEVPCDDFEENETAKLIK